MLGDKSESAGVVDAGFALAGFARHSRASRAPISPVSTGPQRGGIRGGEPKRLCRAHRRAITQIYDGTNEIQRLVIARGLRWPRATSR